MLLSFNSYTSMKTLVGETKRTNVLQIREYICLFVKFKTILIGIYNFKYQFSVI